MATKSKNVNEVTTNDDFIGRMEQEFKEVNERYTKLHDSLMSGEKFLKKVGEEQYTLLVDQAEAMEKYRNTLAIRIMLLKK